jgi:hypothetical protein
MHDLWKKILSSSQMVHKGNQSNHPLPTFKFCIDCAEVNWKKRFQTARCHGYISIVTGARIKIGFSEISLKFLIFQFPHSFEIATSRLPSHSYHSFPPRCSSALLQSITNLQIPVTPKEKDFETWKDRLEIYGIDFRDLRCIEAFAQHVTDNYPYLSILINNAAQTVRRYWPTAHS